MERVNAVYAVRCPFLIVSLCNFQANCQVDKVDTSDAMVSTFKAQRCISNVLF